MFYLFPAPSWPLALICLLSATCLAQNPSPELSERFIRRQNLLTEQRERPPTIEAGDDIGIVELVQHYPKPPTFSVETDQQFFYTDNAKLADHDRRASFGWSGWLSASYIPYSTYAWTPRLEVEHFMLRHERAASADLDGQTVTVSSSLGLVPDNSVWWDLSYAYRRLTEAHGDGEFYRDGRLEHRLNWLQPLLDRGDLSFLASYALQYRHASPSSLDRINNALSLSIICHPLDKLSLEAYLQPEFHIYRHDTSSTRGRKDVNLTTGILAHWRLLKQLSVEAEFAWLANDSNRGEEDYQAILPSVGLFGRIAF